MEKNIWLDGMMGLVTGDALGVPVQFLSREKIKNRPEGPLTGMESDGTYGMPAGTWSDDSSMALATLNSIIMKKKVDPFDIMQQFVRWEGEGEYTPYGQAFDEGTTCLNAIYRFYRDQDINDCGIKEENANGNGALMRIMPACLYYYVKGSDDAGAIKGIHQVGGLTHNHLRSKMCCGFYYFMVKEILDGINAEEKPGLLSLLQKGISRGIGFYGNGVAESEEMKYLRRLFDLNELCATPENEINSSGYVIDSIEAAVWCLITTGSYRECMVKAANLGEDTDTVAAIAGGLAGLYYGYDGIPSEWLTVIKRREWIEGLCRRAEVRITG